MEEIQNFLEGVIGWMEVHPVISAGIFTISGVLISALLDIRGHILKIVLKKRTHIKQNIKTIKKSRKFNGFNNWFNNWFSGTKKRSDEPKEDFRQKIVSETSQSPLTPNENKICNQILSITEVYHLDKLDLGPLYKKAVKEKYTNGVQSAALEYYQLFNRIIKALQDIAIEKGAKTEIGNLITVVNGLSEMLNNSTEDEELRLQFNSCEKATLNILKIIHEPN